MKKILLYLSAFVPLYFLVSIKIIINFINNNLDFNFLNIISLFFFIFLIILGVFGAILSINHKNTPSTKIKIIKKKSITEQYFLGYFSLFVLFALTFELEQICMFIVFILIIILIGIVYIRNDLFYINPFLNILGYNFYNITFEVFDDKKSKHTVICFYKGMLDTTKSFYYAKLSHQNFSMIEKL